MWISRHVPVALGDSAVSTNGRQRRYAIFTEILEGLLNLLLFVLRLPIEILSPRLYAAGRGPTYRRITLRDDFIKEHQARLAHKWDRVAAWAREMIRTGTEVWAERDAKAGLHPQAKAPTTSHSEQARARLPKNQSQLGNWGFKPPSPRK